MLLESLLDFLFSWIGSDGFDDELSLEMIDDVHPVEIWSMFDGGEELLG